MVSYLISFAIGDYVKVEDNYKDLPVAYWVYPENQNEEVPLWFGEPHESTPDIISRAAKEALDN